jgi:hypothetical protein
VRANSRQAWRHEKREGVAEEEGGDYQFANDLSDQFLNDLSESRDRCVRLVGRSLDKFVIAAA